MRITKTLTALAMWSGAALLLLAGCGPSVSTDYGNTSGSSSNTGSTGGTLSGLGYTWVAGTSGTTSDFRSVAFGNNVWVAVGTGAGVGLIGKSTDGKAWTLTSENATSYYDLINVAFGNNTFVALSGTNGILTSSDGVNWAPATVNATTTTGGSPLPQNLTAAVYGNGLWIAVDNMFYTDDGFGIWKSTDNGASWNVEFLSGGYAQPTAMAYGNGTYVIVGYGGLVLTSQDGTNWTNRTFTTGQAMMGITYANNEFVAITNDGHSLVSTDGINWTSYPMDYSYMNGVSYGGGIFLAYGALSGAVAEVSTDGKTWTSATSYLPNSIASSSLHGAAYGNSAFVVAGDSGVVAVSQ